MNIRDAAERVHDELENRTPATFAFDWMGLLVQLIPLLIGLCGKRNEPEQLKKKAARASQRGRGSLAWNLVRGRVRRAYRSKHGKKLKKDLADDLTGAFVSAAGKAEVSEIEDLYLEVE